MELLEMMAVLACFASISQIVAHYFPKLVDLHNYSAANSMCTKMYNWNTLNAKVFKRLRFSLPQEECEACAGGTPGAIERVLKLLQVKVRMRM